MKRCSLLCAGAWPFIFLPLLLLLPLLFFKWHAIEENVAGSAQADLALAGTNWATVETTNRGRDALITGVPPNKAAIELVKQKVALSNGVNRVDISSDVKPVLIAAIAAELDITIAGDTLVLRGTMANQDSINSLITDAESVFLAANISNNIRVGSNTLALPNLNGLLANLADKLFWSETLNASLKGKQLSLKGTVNSRQSNSTLVSQITSELGLEVSNDLAIADATQKLHLCQSLINQLLSERKISFMSGEVTIQETSFGLLKDIKSASRYCPEANFDVTGHTDSNGNLSFNMTLSGLRAQAVVDHLIKLGLNAVRLNAFSNGPNKPIADNSTAEGRAQNRRIELTVTN